eukprot:COSAG03_NODE_628_length_6625_cov_9.247165_9_plen_113_part_00
MASWEPGVATEIKKKIGGARKFPIHLWKIVPTNETVTQSFFTPICHCQSFVTVSLCLSVSLSVSMSLCLSVSLTQVDTGPTPEVPAGFTPDIYNVQPQLGFYCLCALHPVHM